VILTMDELIQIVNPAIYLLPCPFCGKAVQFEENPSKVVDGVAFAVMCVTEDCILYDALPSLQPTKAAAAIAWNKRA
jgi:hypothetical protein